jgi:hypothetical protein
MSACTPTGTADVQGSITDCFPKECAHASPSILRREYPPTESGRWPVSWLASNKSRAVNATIPQLKGSASSSSSERRQGSAARATTSVGTLQFAQRLSSARRLPYPAGEPTPGCPGE